MPNMTTLGSTNATTTKDISFVSMTSLPESTKLQHTSSSLEPILDSVNHDNPKHDFSVDPKCDD